MPRRASIPERSKEVVDDNYEWMKARVCEEFWNRVDYIDPGECTDIRNIHLNYWFGDVWKGELYVCKNTEPPIKENLLLRNFKKGLLNDVDRERPMLESHFLSMLSHHGLPDYYERMKDGINLYIVTCDIPYGSFLDLLAVRRPARTRLGEQESHPYLHQLYHALEYLHERGIVHRSVSLEHCLLFQHGRVKLFDFTCATAAKEPRGLFGCRRYASPQMFNGEVYRYDADWWAFGVVIFKLFWGHFPFDGETDDEIATSVLTSRLRLKKNNLSEDLLYVTFHLLMPAVAKRLSGSSESNPGSNLIRTQAWFVNDSQERFKSPDYENPDFKMNPFEGKEVDPLKFKTMLTPETVEDAELFKYF